MKRDSVVIYRNLFEALQDVSDKAYKRIMNAILKYSMDGEETQLTGVEKAVFQMAKTQVDANNKKYENGKKGAEFGVLGGRPAKNKEVQETEEKPQENPTETPPKPLNDKCKMINDLKESKKVNIENNNIHAHARESYDEIIDAFEFSKPVESKIKSFIQHCLANKHVPTNEKLESMLVQLDLKHDNDESRIAVLNDAINYGYFCIKG